MEGEQVYQEVTFTMPRKQVNAIWRKCRDKKLKEITLRVVLPTQNIKYIAADTQSFEGNQPKGD